MEARHCLAAASVIATLAGEIPSEAAAKESEFRSGPSDCPFFYIICIFWVSLHFLFSFLYDVPWLTNENRSP